MSLYAKIVDNYAIIESEKLSNDLYSRGWYGNLMENGLLKLDSHETILLLERGKIEIINKEKEIINLSQAVAHFSELIPNFLVHYMLYKDLRSRGYVVKRYEKEDSFFKLYERGASPNKKKEMEFGLIVPFIEGVLFNIDEIEQIISQATKIELELIFAVIDSLGDVSYYSVDSLDFPKLREVNKSDIW